MTDEEAIRALIEGKVLEDPYRVKMRLRNGRLQHVASASRLAELVIPIAFFGISPKNMQVCKDVHEIYCKIVNHGYDIYHNGVLVASAGYEETKDLIVKALRDKYGCEEWVD